MENTLKELFGFGKFNHGQKEVIEKILNGDSAVAIFPTGKGKSLCYQFPATQLPDLTLVVSPLLSLIQDQLDFLSKNKIPAARIDSTLDREEEQKIMEQIKNGAIKILMISVERFKNERFRNFLSQIKISLMVIDEAHCISEWGHNFRPDYLKLPQYREDFSIRQVLLLTATATPKVASDMLRKFKIEEDNLVSTGFYRENLNIKVLPTSVKDKNNYLLKILAQKKSSIVYVTLQNTAKEVAEYLIHEGVNAAYYHAGLSNEERELIQRKFMTNKTDVIVATIAFGMGIDKRDIRTIIHYDLPKSIENYSQEIGRAGRDGLAADCILLGNKENVTILENFIYGDTPEYNAVDFIVNSIPLDGSDWEIQMYKLSVLADIRQLPLKTMLVYLELEGIIQSKYAYFKEYRFKNNMTNDDILAQFTGERKEFVSNVLSCAEKAKTWSYIDINACCEKFSYDRKRVISALEYFHQNNSIYLDSKGITETYQILKTDFNPEETARKLYDLFKEKEIAEIKRINKMIAFFEKDTCLSYALASYFGQKLDKKSCGHCSVCNSEPVKLYDGVSYRSLNDIPFNVVRENFIRYVPDEVTTDLVTRFLCGINTPKLSKLKAQRLKGFGDLETFPYNEVKSWVLKNLVLND